MSKRPSLEELFMGWAVQLTTRSTCKRVGVACLIASEDLENIHSIGYNGTARGFPNDDCRNEVGNCGCVHAEPNAIAKVPIKDKRKVFFLTSEPCELCAKLVVNTGASKVYYKPHIRPVGGAEILRRGGIETVKL